MERMLNHNYAQIIQDKLISFQKHNYAHNYAQTLYHKIAQTIQHKISLQKLESNNNFQKIETRVIKVRMLIMDEYIRVDRYKREMAD